MKNRVAKNFNERGISLIVLIITIIVIIVLVAAVILTLTGNNPIENAKQAQFENDLDTFKSELDLYKAQEYATTQGSFLPKELFATQTSMTYNGELQIDKTMFNAITSLKGKAKYENKFEIIEGKLCYIGTNNKEKEWAPDAGVEVLSDEPQISITSLNTLPIKAGVNATYSLGMLCGMPITVQTISNSNIKVLNGSGVELVPQPSISGEITGTENKKIAEIEINTTGIPEGIYKIKVLENTVQTSTLGNEEITGKGLFEIDNTAPNMPTIDITPSIPTSDNVLVTITKASISDVLEYSTNGTTWLPYTTPLTVTSDLTIYARETDSANNISNQSTQIINNIDKTVPENAILNVSTDADKINGTLTLTDTRSGIELTQSKYMITTQVTPYSINSIEWNVANQFTTNPQTISVTEPNGEYYVHTLSVDKTGNKRVNVSEKLTVSNIVVNAPILATGMTAIKWNSSTNTWDTVSNPNIDKSWYNYSSKQWANAITKDTNNNITGYFVWIPRYEYKITTTHTNTVQTIDINFINGIGITPTSGYKMHPAFTFDSKQLEGIWVAKFEASGVSNSINIIPNTPPLVNMTIDAFFTASRNMENNTAKYGWSTTNLDTHLMKNIEWGAVAYLSNSIYGKNSKITINNVNNNIAGGDYITNVSQSTTGNISGIYGMSGGEFEYIAAYVNNGNANLTTFGSSLINALSKYKDVYSRGTSDTSALNYNANNTKFGDAVYETSTSGTGTTSWYNELSLMPCTTFPFFMRGGSWHDTSAGIFGFSTYNITGGDANDDYGFRPVVVLGEGL